MTERLPSVSTAEVIRVLKRRGYTVEPNRGKGSHVVLSRVNDLGRTIVVVPQRKSLAKGTLNAVLRQAGVGRDEFLRALQE